MAVIKWGNMTFELKAKDELWSSDFDELDTAMLCNQLVIMLNAAKCYYEQIGFIADVRRIEELQRELRKVYKPEE